MEAGQHDANPAHPRGMEPVRSTAAEEMAAFDALPRPLRELLNDGPWNLSAVHALETARRIGPHLTLALTRETMAMGPEGDGSEGGGR